MRTPSARAVRTGGFGKFAIGADAAKLPAAALAGLLAAVTQPASAQQLPTLHVRGFDMSTDRATVSVGEPFHLRIVAHVGEPLAALDGIVLPNLSGFEELGDERRCASFEHGTDCVETLTLDATAPGDQQIGPATLDAIDARTRRPSRFATNAVVVHVGGDPLGTGGRIAFAAAMWFVVWLASFAAFVTAATLFVRWLRRGRTGRRIVAPISPAADRPAPRAALDPDERFRALVTALAQEPTRQRALAVRAALRERAGASEHETLRDLTARGALENGIAPAMAALERATFGAEEHLAEAVREALPYLR